MKKNILIVDDDPVQCRINEELFKREGYNSVNVDNGEKAISLLSEQTAGQEHFDLILLDLVMPVVDGMQVLNEISKRGITIPVIVQTAYGSINRVIAAMKAGASDFVIKPVNPQKLLEVIERACKVDIASKKNYKSKSRSAQEQKPASLSNFATKNNVMKAIIKKTQKAATSHIPILIEGESGVGKELMARAIKNDSRRADKKFVTINCGAIPENLVESILFGHEKGSFTGASGKHNGKFCEADGGTLFLDEVGELSLDIQVKLLRALQEGEIEPVGSTKTIKIDIRIISATNKNLMQLVEQKLFREDLYYRLSTFPIILLPLRERKEDIEDLAETFRQYYTHREKKNIASYSEKATQLLCQYDWPGNIRQLKSAVFRAVVLGDKTKLEVDDFEQIVQLIAAGKKIEEQNHFHYNKNTLDQISILNGRGDLRRLNDMEGDIIKAAIKRYNGSLSKVACMLGIEQNMLYQKIKKHNCQI